MNNLVLLVTNCRSVKNKVGKPEGLINSVGADIVIGTESWLEPTVADHEVFPSDLVVFLCS